MPTRTLDASGNPQNIDLSFLKAGSTTQDEVSRHLAGIDTHVNENGFFWGRWASSSLVYTRNGTRSWGERNILVEFDQKGIVKRWILTGDKKLQGQLDQVISADPPPNFSPPIRVQAQVFDAPGTADLVLAADYFLCEDQQASSVDRRRSGCSGQRIPRAKIRGITSRWIIHNRPDPLIWATLHFDKARPDPAGGGTNHLSAGVDPPSLLLLHRYIRQTH